MRIPFYLFCLFPITAFSAIPVPLTAEEMAYHEKMASPAAAPAFVRDMTADEDASRELRFKPVDSFEGMEKSVRVLQDAENKDNERVNGLMKAFLTNAGASPEGLIMSPVSAPVSEQVKKEVGAAPKEGEKPKTEPMDINCKDGMYFDPEEGLLVYLKDIVLKDPRFGLTCDNQLKVYLERGEKKKKKQEDKTPSEPGAEEKKADKGLKLPDEEAFNFDGIKFIAASGNVVLTRKDKQGKMMVARAEKVTYDGKTGEIILSGGDKQSVNDGEQLLETKGPGCFIRIYGDGKVYVKGDRIITQLRTSDEKGKPLKMKKK